jgi:sensor domain CHASE-containing protein
VIAYSFHPDAAPAIGAAANSANLRKLQTNPKAEVARMLEALPEDCSFEDIQYHLYVLEKVRRGLERAATEGTVSHQDVKARLDRWFTT